MRRRILTHKAHTHLHMNAQTSANSFPHALCLRSRAYTHPNEPMAIFVQPRACGMVTLCSAYHEGKAAPFISDWSSKRVHYTNWPSPINAVCALNSETKLAA